MNQEVRQKFKRLSLYYLRVASDLDDGNQTQALADLAELSGCVRRLWNVIAGENAKETRWEFDPNRLRKP